MNSFSLTRLSNAFDCPKCGAASGDRCRSRWTGEATYHPHPERLALAREARARQVRLEEQPGGE